MGGRSAVELGEVRIEVAASLPRLVDHRRESGGLGLEDLDLAVDPGPRVEDERSSLVGIAGLAEPLAIALARPVVLEKLADLREREAGVVAEAPDEPEPLEVGRVVQAVVAIRPGRRLEQADLFVVADRARRQAGLGRDLVDAQQTGGGGQGHLPPNATTTLTLT